MAYNGFESSEEALKVKYRPLLLACQAALRSIPAGAADMFRVLDRNVHGSLGQFNPADIAHCITVPCITRRNAHSTRKAAADALAIPLRKVLYSLDDMAGNPTLSERQAQQESLLRLIDAAHVMYVKLNG